MKPITLTVNGRAVAATVEPRTHLADFLRETQGLTGTHLGCEHGICGACTLLVDGVPVRSCITWAVACDGADVTTIEGLDDDEIARELRTAFSREHALQCGYCTPGMLIAARDLALRAERQFVPLHRLCRHHPRRDGRDRRAAGAGHPGRARCGPHGDRSGRLGPRTHARRCGCSGAAGRRGDAQPFERGATGVG